MTPHKPSWINLTPKLRSIRISTFAIFQCLNLVLILNLDSRLVTGASSQAVALAALSVGADLTFSTFIASFSVTVFCCKRLSRG